jgi:hypothetical protein
MVPVVVAICVLAVALLVLYKWRIHQLTKPATSGAARPGAVDNPTYESSGWPAGGARMPSGDTGGYLEVGGAAK